MRRLLGSFTIGLLSLTAASINADNCCCPERSCLWGYESSSCHVTPVTECMNLSIGAGYRQDSIKWSRAGAAGFPNIADEQKWKHLRIFDMQIVADYHFCHHFFVWGKGDYGNVYKGKHEDTTYAGNNRTLLLTDTIAKTTKSHVYDYSGALGYDWVMCGGQWVLSPMVGYSQHGQHLKSHDPGSDTYRANWTGPWAGAMFHLQPICGWIFAGGAEYHWARYKASGESLTEDYRQRSHADGVVANLSASFFTACGWVFDISTSWQQWKTRHNGTHKDITTAALDGATVQLFTDYTLNHVKWTSWNVIVSGTLQF